MFPLCVCYWPPISEICPDYKVVMFQPQTLTTTDLGSVANFYIAYLLNYPQPLLLPYNVCPGGVSPLLSQLPSHQRPFFWRTILSSHPGVTRLHPGIPKKLHPRPPHPSLTESDSSSTPSTLSCLQNYRNHRSLSAILFYFIFHLY